MPTDNRSSNNGTAGQSLGRIEATRRFNDLLREKGVGGRVVVTSGIAALSAHEVARIRAAVAAFEDFEDGNDPYGEHDLGALTVEGEMILWKIDYYDREMVMHSPDAADPAVTVRVLTIMFSTEY